MGTSLDEVPGAAAGWSQGLRIDPAKAALRPFLAAYLVVLGVSITLLPVVRASGVTDEWPRGLLTAVSGLVVMWLGLLRPGRVASALHLLTGSPQIVLGIGMAITGLPVGGVTLALVGAATVALPALDRLPGRTSHVRGDVLTYLLLGALTMQGASVAARLDGTASVVEQAGWPPEMVGLVLAGLGLGAAAAWWWEASRMGAILTMAGGLALLGMVAISASVLGPTLWILSGATYLRIGAMLVTPVRVRWTTAQWRSLAMVVALALVTAGVIPILIVAGIEHLTGILEGSSLRARQMQFAAATFALLIVAVAGIVGGRLLARPIGHLRARVAALPLGPSERPTDAVEVSELAEIGRAIDEASVALFAERRQKDELIATLQERNRELAAATAAKDEFLGMVSHELKTPITAVLGYAELLAHPHLRASDELVDDIREEANRLGSIVDNLLALARLDAGQPPDQEPVVLQSLVAEALRRIGRLAPERRLRADIPRSLIVEVASDHLHLVLRNLLSNAIKYGDPTGEVVLSAATVQDRAVITITDGGRGVPAEQQEAVFEPFFRSPTTAATAPGMGIGLAVCRRVVEANGGACWAEPIADGGTAFKVSLPLAV